ncbi:MULTISPECIES: hypothetical protein [Lysinibacillus]|uniref:Uncharacterized protein n=1 Tax=Lysinibacillus antri TaxID=2498145 RepID=A0A432LGL4_9BACI|nr:MULTISPECIES: hypothetical protein [Lysinibacillus]RUL57038.1 hypothetical protein EK386_01055 [Lysinibacillus antri]TSI03329.1 hypothetical protein FJQ64_17665 [Lysinibacillus sp. BW-2-10]
MFIQAFFKQDKQSQSVEITYAEKFLEITRTLLYKELPDHQTQHHILLTANRNIEHMNEQLTTHRKQIQPEYKLGQYHQQIYDELRKRISDLQTLIDGYMELNIDLQQMNHRLHFHHNAIDYLYNNYFLTKEKAFDEQSEILFWKALKEDVLEIIRKVL